MRSWAGSLWAWRCSLAWSRSLVRSEWRATGKSSVSAPAVSASARVISPAWDKDMSPAKNAALVWGQSIRASAVSNAWRAWAPVIPDWRASHAAACPKPRSLWAPAATARAAANNRRAAQQFSVTANSSASRAHSVPDNPSISTAATTWRNPAAAASTESATAPPPPPTSTKRLGGDRQPDPEALPTHYPNRRSMSSRKKGDGRTIRP